MEWESPAIAREILPESALFQSKENYYRDAKAALGAEIEKCERAYQNIDGSAQVKAKLEDAIHRAKEVRDQDYLDVEEVDEIILAMNQAAAELSEIKTELYLSVGTQKSDYFTEFSNPLYQGRTVCGSERWLFIICPHPAMMTVNAKSMSQVQNPDRPG